MSESVKAKNACKVRQTLKWSCGDCFTTLQEADAIQHVKETGHTMDVKGTLSLMRKLSRKRRARLRRRYKRTESTEAQ